MTKAIKFIRNTPQLPVKNLRMTLDYYLDKLGFTDEWVFGDKDGGLRKVELRLLFGEDSAFTNDVNNQQHRLSLMWFVDNIENVFLEYQRRNVELADGLRVHAYGLREFAFFDINGYYIRVAEPIQEEYYEL
jgi:hypothetical protein